MRVYLRNRRIRDPSVRWCGRGERATAPPIPILAFFPVAVLNKNNLRIEPIATCQSQPKDNTVHLSGSLNHYV
jgi:hypothetical protein